jgi:hypothetical protein
MTEAFDLGQRIGVIDDGEREICHTPAAVAASKDPRVSRFVETLAVRQPPVSNQPPSTARPG